MKHKIRGYSEEVYEYIRNNSLRLPNYMAELMQETSQMPESMMATPPEQGQLLYFLMKAIGAKRAIEVGVFTGIGTMWLANAVGDDGSVIACDLNSEFTSIAQAYWHKSGLAQTIDLRLAPAQQTLQHLIDGGQSSSFDFCYIDADKEGYHTYYELCFQLIRPGGIIAFDNMLYGGRVADSNCNEKPIPNIRALNKALHNDKRVEVSFMAIGDGLYLVRKL